jgi:PAS domain S-box-containing protein
MFTDWLFTAVPRVLALRQWDYTEVHRASGVMISLACLVAGLFLILRYLRPWSRRVPPYRGIVWMISGFLLLCALSHFLDVIDVGPSTPITGGITLLLAGASWTIVFALALCCCKTPMPPDPREFLREVEDRRRAEEALQRSEALARKLALVASRTNNAVIITDSQVRIEWVNEGFTRITGYTLDEVTGRRPGAFLQGPETEPAAIRLMRERVHAGQGFQIEILNYAKCGRKHWLFVEVQPIYDDAGQLTNFVAIETDITERKRAERRMEIQHATMQILTGCGRLEDVIPRLLSTIGKTLDFDVAEFWLVDQSAGVMHLAGAPWTSERISSDWLEASRTLVFPPGVGLSGRVWETGRSSWISDLTREPVDSLVRARLAIDLGLRSAFSFPVVASESGPALGVMTLLSRECLQCDEPLLQAMTTLGRQIGLFVERRRAERDLRSSEARFRRLVEANIFGVVFGDIDGNITDANDAFLEMVGYTRAEMMAGKLPWDALVPPSSTPLLRRSRVELQRRGRCAPFELECRARSGGILRVLMGVALLDENRPVESGAPVVAFCLDVSERRRLEDQLREHANELADEHVRKNQFLAMLGHELRNPLAPIRNAVKIMKQRGSDDPTLCWARDVIDQQMRQMSQLVDDLLEISRVTRGKVRLQKEVVDVATIVAYAVETSRPLVDARRHRLSISLPGAPVSVEADPVRMAQVLSNLLNNAAKYTQEGGQIRMIASVEDAKVAFRVRDNGIGIPPEMLASVFDLFTQVDHSLDHSQGGLGLGLTLVRSLVEMHGGTVRALSEGQDRGSEFVVTLPIWTPEATPSSEGAGPPAAAASAEPASALQADAPVRSYKVLVVDDNVTSAQSLELLLRLEGHRSQVAYDGPSALEAVRKHRHDVVLMDIGLPGMNGYEVARRLRQEEPELGRRLLVAITGYAEDEARRLSREAGFDHHLVKPVDPDAVLALLASLEWSATVADPDAPEMESSPFCEPVASPP